MNKYQPLVSLRQGRLSSQGAIFFLPGAGDGITNFVALTEVMNNSLPVFGLQPRGLSGDQDPYPSIETMVSEYIDAIRSKVNNGPYYIVGHSFGGYVALSMAESLIKLGSDVAPLVLLDVSPPEKKPINKSRVDNLLSLIDVMELVSKNSFNLSFDTLTSLDDEAQLQILHDRMIANKMMPKQSRPDSIRGMVNVFIANQHMKYWPEKKYEGPALYIGAMDTKENRKKRYENFKRWCQFIPKLKYIESVGNHMTLLNRQNVGGLVKHFEKVWACSAHTPIL